MSDKLSNPVVTHLDDKLFRFLKLTAEHTDTDISKVIRLFLTVAYEAKMDELNVFDELLADKR